MTDSSAIYTLHFDADCFKNHSGSEKMLKELFEEYQNDFDEITKDDRLPKILKVWHRELMKRPSPLIDSTEKAAAHLNQIRSEKQKHLAVITIDEARRLINTHIISKGTLTSVLVHPREIFSVAIQDRAASIIIAHNHPSGQLGLDSRDTEITQRIKKAGELLGIPLDDHIIITERGFRSALKTENQER
jgi:DNA repair protein RadC